MPDFLWWRHCADQTVRQWLTSGGGCGAAVAYHPATLSQQVPAPALPRFGSLLSSLPSTSPSLHDYYQLTSTSLSSRPTSSYLVSRILRSFGFLSALPLFIIVLDSAPSVRSACHPFLSARPGSRSPRRFGCLNSVYRFLRFWYWEY